MEEKMDKTRGFEIAKGYENKGINILLEKLRILQVMMLRLLKM